MSDLRHLLFVSEEAVVLVKSDATTTTDAARVWAGSGLTVRAVRGRKMRTVDGLFDEMAAALQFPYYFGENWPAFSECLGDMDWLPKGVGIVIVILDAIEVLADSADVEMDVFVRAVSAAHSAYSVPIESGEWWDRPALPFHVVLQSACEGLPTLRARWQERGATILDLAR